MEVERTASFVLKNLHKPTTNSGVEALAVWKAEDFSFVANYAYVRSRETTDEGRVDVPLTPRQSVGLDAAWEWEGAGRLGVEWFYTGAQRLEANPYRAESRPYSVFGVLTTRRVGRLLLFINGENLTDVRQTRWQTLLRPTRGIDGRWTVDAWAPLDGRNINGGVRLAFCGVYWRPMAGGTIVLSRRATFATESLTTTRTIRPRDNHAIVGRLLLN